MVTFCWAQVDAPTRIGSNSGDGSGLARSSHRKLLFIGATVSNTGFQEYSLWDNPTRSSGLVPRVFNKAW